MDRWATGIERVFVNPNRGGEGEIFFVVEIDCVANRLCQYLNDCNEDTGYVTEGNRRKGDGRKRRRSLAFSRRMA